ncbi:hypothetical protein E2C01_035922 [Portunus trituberculatus]|uniref:Uncharacterized protein n=1 Tax=Portunus trituberculatus TaxID=210409 RepID=A0A5B7FB12_PORTR|nr:hypothetical protein [Portunus trituberculatus]
MKIGFGIFFRHIGPGAVQASTEGVPARPKKRDWKRDAPPDVPDRVGSALEVDGRESCLENRFFSSSVENAAPVGFFGDVAPSVDLLLSVLLERDRRRSMDAVSKELDDERLNGYERCVTLVTPVSTLVLRDGAVRLDAEPAPKTLLLSPRRRVDSSSLVTEDVGEWLADDLGEVEVRSLRL